MNRKTCAVALAVATFVLAAGAVDFPSAGGDIASVSTGEPVKITQAGTYYNSDDVSFNSITVTATGVTFDLGRYGKSVTLTDTSESFRPFGSSLETTISGGAWTNKGPFWVGGRQNTSKNHNAVAVTDGCDIYFAKGINLGNCNGARLAIDGATAYSAADVNMADSGSSGDYVFEVLNGATFHSAEHFYGGKSGGGINRIKISGAGTKFTITAGKNFHGYKNSAFAIEVSDGASANVGGLYLGSGPSATNYGNYHNLIVSNATLHTKSNMYLGRYGRGNYAYFTNATISSAADFKIGQGATSSNNVVVFSGTGTTLSHVSSLATPFFGSGCHNTLVFENGASHTLTTGADVTLSGSANHNTIRISGDGAALIKTGMKIYMSTSDENSYANSIIVENGGTFQFYDMFVCRQDNRLVVSNGTLTTLRNDPTSYSLHIGHVNSLAVTTNNALVIQGDSPKVDFPSTGFSLANGSRLHFDVPASGEYVETPIQVMNLDLSADSVLEVDCMACKTAGWKGTRRMILAEMHTSQNGNNILGGNLTIPQTVLDAANANLPERCQLYIEGRKLMLKVSNPSGFQFIVK